MADYPQALPHDPIKEIIGGVYMVRSTIPFKPMVRISRNMAIIKHNDELTLVNPIRLTAEGEEELKKLGEVKRILRLGPMHGRDDGYYKDTFKAELWAPGQSHYYKEPTIDKVVGEDDDLPFPDAELMIFKNLKPGKEGEGVLLIKRDGGLLLTCDAVQHYGGDYNHHSFLGKNICKMMGFKDTCLGPPWVEEFTPDGGSLKDEFERILKWDFEKLFAAHGCVCEKGAKEEVKKAIDGVYDK